MLFHFPNLPRLWRWGIGLLVVFMVLLGTRFSPCALAALTILALFALAGSQTDVTFFFVLVTPLAVIFRPSPAVQSYLTYVLLLYALASIENTLFVQQKMDGLSLLLLLSFGAAVAVQIANRTLDWKRTLKLMANLILIKDSVCYTTEADCRDIFLGYLTGLIAASVVALTSPGFLAIEKYITAKTLSAEYGLGALCRFSALYDDPNYYGVNVIIGLCLLVVLYEKGQIRRFPLMALSATLFFFGIITYSKSTALMLTLPAMLLMVCAAQRRQYLFLSFLVAAFALFLFAVFSGIISVFDVVAVRFQAEEHSLDALTTGRVGLWQDYLQYISSSPWRALFGSGLGAGYLPTEKGLAAAHNFYIEVVYHLGLSGIVFFAVFLWQVQRRVQVKIHRSIPHGSVFLCIAAMYMALNQLFNFELPAHVIVAFLVWNGDSATGQ